MHSPNCRLASRTVVAAAAVWLSGCIHIGDGQVRDFEKSYKVTGPVTLEIQNGSGDITITPGDATQVRVKGEIRLYDYLMATGTKRTLDDLADKPPITQSGDILRIVRPRPTDAGGVRINYVIQVPTRTEVRVRNGSGAVSVRNIEGPIDLETGSGDIEVLEIQQRTTLTAGSGDIVVRKIAAPLTVTARSGSLEIDTVAGDLRAQSTSGDIRISRPGGQVQVRVTSGDIEIDGVSADLRVSAGSGDCQIRGNPPPSGQWEIETRSGDVVLDVPEHASFLLHARSRHIDTDISLTIEEKSKRELRGRVGKGEARVAIETGSGRVQIR